MANFEVHILDTNTGSSGHSSVSPTTHSAMVWQLPEQPVKRTPPPVKPKPLRKKPAPQPEPSHSSQALLQEPAHHAALCRSHSEEAIRLQPLSKESLRLRPLPRSPRLQRRPSTSSLPTPCLDEDDYTIPTPSFYHPNLRPQPYLQPRSLEYSYAYSHVVAGMVTGAVCTAPRARGPQAAGLVVQQQHDPAHQSSEQTQSWQEQNSRQPPSPSGSSMATSHSSSDQPHLMSTGSEGYVNSDEFPELVRSPPNDQPMVSPPPLGDQPHPHPQGYTQLQASQREAVSTYDVPQASDLPSPPLQPAAMADYDHLHSDQIS